MTISLQNDPPIYSYGLMGDQNIRLPLKGACAGYARSSAADKAW
jgi:hypothetical protein